MSCDKDSEEKPFLTDSAEISKFECVPIRDTFAGKLLKNFLEAMNSLGDEAQAIYDEKLKELSKHAEDVLVEIIRAEGAACEDDYPFRWALVHAASELKHPATLKFLRNLVFAPIPPEKSRDPHSFSTIAEETILRTTAVEGVEYLSKAGNEDAQKTLFDFLKVPSLSVKRASVQAILATVRDKGKLEKLKSALPEDERFLLEIKRVDLKAVPQIEDPQKDLKPDAKDSVKEAPPKMPERKEGENPPKTYRRA